MAEIENVEPLSLLADLLAELAGREERGQGVGGSAGVQENPAAGDVVGLLKQSDELDRRVDLVAGEGSAVGA